MIELPPWSYSQIDCFENCPKQFYHRYVLKEKEPETEALRHGTAVHTSLENYVGKGQLLPMEYARWTPLANTVKKAAEGKDLRVELPVAIDKDFKPTGFFARNVWGRGKIDLCILDHTQAWIGDWKTGKVREKKFQVSVFAGFVFKLFPKVIDIRANNIWLTPARPGETYVFNRASSEHAIWAEILSKLHRMEQCAESGFFPPKPSGLCGWCHVLVCPNNPNKGAVR